MDTIIDALDTVAEELEARGEHRLEAAVSLIAEDVAAEGALSDKQKEYREFFAKKLKKYKVKSPGQLNDEDKKKFFDEIEKEWTKDDD